MRNVRVASVQFEHRAGDKEANLGVITSFVEHAVHAQAEIVVFPECCITGYLFLRHLSRDQLLELAEPVFDGPSSQRLQALSETHGITIGAGLVEKDDDGTLYNTYVVAMPDGRAVRHRKIHCFISEHMASGNEYTVFETPHGCRVGVLTCYDNNLGENVRATALLGAEILLAPHQTGGCKTPDPRTMGVINRSLWNNRHADPKTIEGEFRGDKGRAWLLRWLPARAHDNGIFLVFSNGVGVDDDEIRTGNAMILDPYGNILAETWKADDAMVIADLDAELREYNTGRRWIRTRRPELYGTLTQVTGFEEDTRAVRFEDRSGEA
jgi:predicted amidohydrolase